MALTRKFLAALGIEADKIDEIITAHTETVDALKTERDKYKTDSETLADVTKERVEYKKTAEKSEKDPYKVKYEALKEDFDAFKADIEKSKSAEQKTNAFKALLKDIGVAEKRIDAVVRVTDMDSIKLDSDGKIEGASDLKKTMKEEWSDFIQTTSTKGAVVANPPQNIGGSTAKTREEIRKIKDTTERQKAWAEYIEAQKGM